MALPFPPQKKKEKRKKKKKILVFTTIAKSFLYLNIERKI